MKKFKIGDTVRRICEKNKTDLGEVVEIGDIGTVLADSYLYYGEMFCYVKFEGVNGISECNCGCLELIPAENEINISFSDIEEML